MRIASFLKKRAHVPVIASGHVSYALEDQIDELRRVSDTGVDAVILITNRLAEEHAAPEVWMDHLHQVTDALDPAMPLGFYECPYPYKRLLSLDELRQVAADGRYPLPEGYLLRPVADSAAPAGAERQLPGPVQRQHRTLLSSLRAGAGGLLRRHGQLPSRAVRVAAATTSRPSPKKAETLQSILTMASLIEMQPLPRVRQVRHAARGRAHRPVFAHAQPS